MVNLEKWEEVQHEQVKLGDKIKVVWIETTPDLKTREVHKGRVNRIDGDGDFWLNGTAWMSGDDETEHTTVYRRKAVPFKFPTSVGAVIEGETKHTSGPPRRYIRLRDRWVQDNGSTAFENALATNFQNWKVLSKGVEL